MCREKRWLMNGKRYSRQRELIYEALRQTEQHPTAEMIYQWLKPANPSLSLGTVYRNLALLSDLGEIMVFQQLQLTGVGPLRQHQFIRIGVENTLRIAETAQQRQLGLIAQALKF